ncbi:MAG: stage II sporulation protein M [Salinibacter sp.]
MATRQSMQAERTRDWSRLVRLLDRADRDGLATFQAEELLELGRLYRQAAAELSFVRAHGIDPTYQAELNRLVGRAYGHVYADPPKGLRLDLFIRFVQRDFPQALRRHAAFIIVATAVFLGGAGIASLAMLADAPWARALLPQELNTMVEQVAERHRAGGDWLPGMLRPVASSSIMTNNLGVAFLAFSTGILAGIGPLYVLFFNGLILGAVAVGVSRAGPAAALDFWAFVAPHGVLELPAIMIAGAAGLIVGYALVDPGDDRRPVALKRAASRAMTLVYGVIALLIVAGLIEGFFSPTTLSPSVKLGVAGLIAGVFASYLIRCSRPMENDECSSRWLRSGPPVWHADSD